MRSKLLKKVKNNGRKLRCTIERLCLLNDYVKKAQKQRYSGMGMGKTSLPIPKKEKIDAHE